MRNRVSTEKLGDPDRCVHIADRESDIYELFCASQAAKTHFLIRTSVNRLAVTAIILFLMKCMMNLLRLIAGRIGQLVNYSSIANDVGVSSTTIKSWISVLKACYILFELPPYFNNIRKRVVKSSKLYFCDVGLAAWLLGLETPEQVERDPLRGALYENLLILEVLKQILNQGAKPILHFYRDAKGNEVDLLISTGQIFSAIEIKSGKTFQPEFASGIQHFQKAFQANNTIQGIVWYNGERETVYQDFNVRNPLMHGFAW
jgi:predicted AAA+ superfamily ATPase